MAAYRRRTSSSVYYMEIDVPLVVESSIAATLYPSTKTQTGRAISGVVAVDMTIAPREDGQGWNVSSGAHRLEDLETIAKALVKEGSA